MKTKSVSFGALEFTSMGNHLLVWVPVNKEDDKVWRIRTVVDIC